MGRDGRPNSKEAERLLGFCQVEIQIDDVNDNAPVFSNTPFRTNIKEDLERGILHFMLALLTRMPVVIC